MRVADNVATFDWRDRVQRGKGGPVKNLTNLMLYLRGIEKLGRSLRFNELSNQTEWNGRPLEEPDVIDIRLIIEAEGFQPNDRDIRGAVERVARENAYNPIVDYLNGLKWDGKSRLEGWMTRLLGAPDSTFVRLVSPKVLISAVARAMQPGCKVDTVLVLEGEQGIKKSTAIAALFGEEYTAESVSLFDQHNKMVMAMMGAWVVELAEFVAIARSHHASVKALISMRRDRVVLPYARLASLHPRRCIFFGTINPEAIGYLTDSTGNRRYWPITVTKIDLDGIAIRRDQLWAEAVHRYRAGERWWLEPDEERDASTEQSEREEEDAWVEPLGDKIRSENITELTTDRALSLLAIPHERKDKRAQMRAAAALKSLGFERRTERREDSGAGTRKPQKVWVRP
jgi:putative DNA primase/helicase